MWLHREGSHCIVSLTLCTPAALVSASSYWKSICQGKGHIMYVFCILCIALELGPKKFFTTHDNQLLSLAGIRGLNNFLFPFESFNGRIYTNWSVLKSNFYVKKTQKDGHELLTSHFHEKCNKHKFWWGSSCECASWMFCPFVHIFFDRQKYTAFLPSLRFITGWHFSAKVSTNVLRKK